MAESYVSTTGIGAAAAMLRRMAEGIKRAEERAAEIAAPQIEAELRKDATTKRGNIPWSEEIAYLATDATTKRGNIPPGIVARAQGVVVLVDAPGWVHRKASELGQRKKWAAMMRDAAAAAMQEAVKP